ncbi:hypothetical protein J132_03482 [Termitomyces sp. J132]|nr:hypothetical protein J132_03482 [Termitomyces sp. J132]
MSHGTKWSDCTCGVIKLQIHWTPGHTNFQPNKCVDKLAKEAAGGALSPAEMLLRTLRKGPLPTNISVTHQVALKATKADWKRRWKKSLHYPTMHAIDQSMPSKRYMQLVQTLDRKQSTVLTQLCTQHILLNYHLFWIQHLETLVCPHCSSIMVETM